MDSLGVEEEKGDPVTLILNETKRQDVLSRYCPIHQTSLAVLGVAFNSLMVP